MATLALNEGVPLHEVQDYLGHADPRTTRRYDLGRHRLERTPAYRLLEALMADTRAEADVVGDAPPQEAAASSQFAEGSGG
jgi:integrase